MKPGPVILCNIFQKKYDPPLTERAVCSEMDIRGAKIHFEREKKHETKNDVFFKKKNQFSPVIHWEGVCVSRDYLLFMYFIIII